MAFVGILTGLSDHLWACLASAILLLWGLHDVWHFLHQQRPRDKNLLRDGLLLIALGVIDALELFHSIPNEARLSARVIEANTELEKLQVHTSPRHLAATERAAMMPILRTIAGKPVAVACRLMDGECCDYALDLATTLKEAGCIVPELIKTSMNDFTGRVVLVERGRSDPGVLKALEKAFRVAGVPTSVEPVAENSVGVWYQDVVHVVVGRKAP